MRYLYALLAIALMAVVIAPVIAASEDDTYNMTGDVEAKLRAEWKTKNPTDKWFDYNLGWYNDVCWGFTSSPAHHHDAGHPNGTGTACDSSATDADNLADLEIESNDFEDWTLTFENSENLNTDSKMKLYNAGGEPVDDVRSNNLEMAMCYPGTCLGNCCIFSNPSQGDPYVAFNTKTATGAGADTPYNFWMKFQIEQDSAHWRAGQYRAGVIAVMTV